MKKSRFADSRIRAILKQAENGMPVTIAVRLKSKKKVQNFRELWYEDVAQTLTTQGDFGLEPP